MEKAKIEEIIVNELIKRKETISSMESCTAGYLATTLTNIEGSSNVLKFSAITYSNEYKIRLGVSKEVIKRYGVYSFETARQMAKKISYFSESTYGIGITGKINTQDINNPNGNINEIYASIFNSKKNTYYDLKIKCQKKSRIKCKEEIVKKVLKKFLVVILDK